MTINTGFTDNHRLTRLTDEVSDLRADVVSLRLELALMKKDNEDLQSSEKELRNLFENAPLGYQSLNSEGKIITVNQTWLDLLKYEREDVIGRWFGDFLALNEVEKFEKNLKNFRQITKPAEVEYEMRRSDGQTVVVQITVQVHRDDQGEFLRSHCFLRDITQTKKISDTLAINERKSTLLIDHAPMQVVVVDRHGRFLYLNHVIEPFSSDDLIGKTVFDFIPEDLQEIALQKIKRILENHEYDDFEIPVPLPDGDLKWLHVYAAPIVLQDEVENIVLFSTDITTRKIEEQALIKDRDRLHHMVMKLPGGAVFVEDSKIEMNQRAEEITGYAREELPTVKSWFDTLYGDRSEEIYQAYSAGKADGFPQTNTRAIRKKSGEFRSVEFSSYVDGVIEIWLMSDITERIEAMEKLENHNQELLNLLDDLPVMLDAFDEDGRIVFWNKECEKITGFTVEEILSHDDPLSLLYPQPEYRQQRLEQLHSQGYDSRDWEGNLTTKSGKERIISWFNISGKHPIKGWDAWAVGVDITDHKHLEKSLEQDRDRLHHLVMNIPVGALIIENGRLEINHKVEEITGYSPEELPTVEVWFDTLYPGRVQENIRLYEESKASGFASVDTRKIQRNDGDLRWIEYYGYFDGVHEIWIMHDVTEKVEAEKAIQEQKTLLDQAESIAEMGSFRSEIPDGEVIWSQNLYDILDLEDKFSAADTFGFMDRHVHKDDVEQAKADFQSIVEGKQVRFRFRYRHSTRGTRYLEIQSELVSGKNGEPDKLIGFVQDITDRVHTEHSIKIYSETLEEMVSERTRQLKEAQDELVRKEKLAFLGEIAGSVSHELRNPLGVISNAVYYLQLVYGDSADQQFKEYVELIANEVKDVQGIISDMFNLTKASSPKREAVQVSDLVNTVLERKAPPPDVRIDQEYPDPLPNTFVDERQMRQVILNLVRNAYDAMPEGGTLSFRAYENAEFIHLDIQDTGVGISPENMKKLFIPLFTTKSSGTGLGLTVVQKLVEINDAEISFESEVGVGSTFRLKLPKEKRN